MLGKILNDLKDFGRAIVRYWEKVSKDFGEVVISSCKRYKSYKIYVTILQDLGKDHTRFGKIITKSQLRYRCYMILAKILEDFDENHTRFKEKFYKILVKILQFLGKDLTRSYWSSYTT